MTQKNRGMSFMYEKLRIDRRGSHSQSFRRGLLISFALIITTIGYVAYTLYTSERNSSVLSSGGIHQVIFKTDEGNVTIYLPSDMTSGDEFLIGSFVIHPSGSTIEEQQRNIHLLNKKIVEIAHQRARLSDGKISVKNLPATDYIEVKLTDENGLNICETKIPLMEEQLPKPTRNEIPVIARAGDLITLIGPMENGFNTHFIMGNKEVSMVVKSPRQATFWTPDIIGSHFYEFTEESRKETGKINIAKLTVTSLNYASSGGAQKSYHWMLEGLENVPDQTYPITILFEDNQTRFVSEDKNAITVSVTKEQVINGRAEGRKEVEMNGVPTVSLLGADMFSRGLNARSPWSARIQTNLLIAQQSAPENNDIQIASPSDADGTTPINALSLYCPGESKRDPTHCIDPDLSFGEPRGCESSQSPTGGFIPCVSVKIGDKFDGCLSKNNPKRCNSKDNPKECETSVRNPKQCVTMQVKTCGTGNECLSQYAPDRCKSVQKPKECESREQPDKCASPQQPDKCITMQLKTCNTSTECLSANEPDKCKSVKKPTECESKAHPDKCSTRQPEYCRTMQLKTCNTSADCMKSVKNPKECESEKNPIECVSKKYPDKCSTGTPPRCESYKTDGGFEPCMSNKLPNGKYDGCYSQKNPKECLSKIDPKQCRSQYDPNYCPSKATPQNCK